MDQQLFTCLSDQVLVYEPSLTNIRTDQISHAPTTIMLYGWGDGLLKHVVKYSAGYHKQYPQARIVIVISPIRKAMFSTLAQRTRSMAVALKAGIAERSSAPEDAKGAYPNNRILLHCFSNTGAINLVATLYAYKQWFSGLEWTKTIMSGIPQQSSTTFPFTLLVCDSTPGGYRWSENFWRWAHAMALGLAPYFPWPFILTKLICSGVLSINHFLSWVISLPIPLHACRAMLDPDLINIAGSRLYIASMADKLIGWNHIVENGEAARSEGFNVDVKLFSDSPHVGHMRMYPDEYWLEIRKAWELALDRKGSTH